jgi:hypothetical protein
MMTKFEVVLVLLLVLLVQLLVLIKPPQKKCASIRTVTKSLWQLMASENHLSDKSNQTTRQTPHQDRHLYLNIGFVVKEGNQCESFVFTQFISTKKMLEII